MTDWTSNIQHLKDIQTQDSVFWAQLKCIAEALKTSDCQYFNDHKRSSMDSDPELDKLTTIGIVQKFSDYHQLITSSNPTKYNGDSPLAWVFPLTKRRICKNPLYFDDKGRLHETTYAHGMHLGDYDTRDLFEGKVTRRVYTLYQHAEATFALPVDVFVATMLA